MVAGDFQSEGNGTVSASGPGVIASVTVTDASVAVASNILIQPTSSPRDALGGFNYYVTTAAGSFTVTMDREQLPEDFTFNYISFEGA